MSSLAQILIIKNAARINYPILIPLQELTNLLVKHVLVASPRVVVLIQIHRNVYIVGKDPAGDMILDRENIVNVMEILQNAALETLCLP